VAGLDISLRLGGSEIDRSLCGHKWGGYHCFDDYRYGKIMTDNDILSSIPFRTDNEEVKWFYENEIIVITYPKKFGKMEKWLQNRIGGPEKVRRPLDKYSSCIWEMCDGKNNVGEVILKFDEKFGEEVAPASDRVQLFLKTLLDLNLIILK
tara:strand:+ start:631 stop:1083 length:453 start_codon:yes stop_codon:yes gene_type:complete